MRRVSGLALVLALVPLVACGDSDDAAPIGTPTGTPPAMRAETVLGRPQADDFVNAMAALPGGGLAVVGQSGRAGWVVRLDDPLAVTDQQTLPTRASSRSVIALVPRAGGGIDVAGSDWSVDKPGNAWAARLDSRSTVLWESLFPETGFFSQVNGMAGLPGDGLAVLGVDFQNANGASDETVWLRRLDRDGRITAETKLPRGVGAGSAAAVAAMADGSVVLAGRRANPEGLDNGWVRRIAPDGATRWEVTLRPKQAGELLSVLGTVDGGVVAVGFTRARPQRPGDGPGEADGWVVRLDGSGKVVWEMRSGVAGSDDGFDRVLLLPDGGLVVSGAIERPDGSAGGSLLVWRLGSDGKSAWRLDLSRSPLLFKIAAMARLADGRTVLAVSPDGRVSDADSRVIALAPEAK